MNKIGIVTFHNALSYGAVLQCYALQQFLRRNGLDADVIDYTCAYIETHYKRLLTIDPHRPVRSLAGAGLKAPAKRKQLRAFARFRRQYLTLSEPCTRQTLPALAAQYAAFLAGSDQIWSPTCAGFDPTYFLDFARPAQRFSYAASFGTTILPAELTADYRRLLADFAAISVREPSGAALADSLCGRDVPCHIDPALLLDRAEWDAIADTSVCPSRPYILAFSVQKPRAMLDYALALGRQAGLPVYDLTDRPFARRPGLRRIPPVSPTGFLGLIRNARFVVTNSFHATAFALLYHTPFAVEPETLGPRNHRSEELLARLDMSDRLLTADAQPGLHGAVDWPRTDRLLEAERTRALAYLRSVKHTIFPPGAGHSEPI